MQIEPGALALIVRAAEGSVRDGLSLVDQAIALAGGEAITAAQVQAMLGLADRSRVLDLFEHVARGAIKDALDCLAELYALGTEPEAGAAGSARDQPLADPDQAPRGGAG